MAVATGLFALGHLPSPILTAVTVVWGAAACWLFLRYRNVFTLGVAHAVLGVCVAITGAGAGGPQYARGAGVSAVPSAGFVAWSPEPERP